MRRVSMVSYSRNHGNRNAVRRCLLDKMIYFYVLIGFDQKADKLEFVGMPKASPV